MELAYLIGGVVLGFAAAVIFLWARSARQVAAASRLGAQIEERDHRVQELQAALAQREEALRAAAEARTALETRLARTTAEMEAVRREAEEKLALVHDARAKFEETFKALAGETLRANSDEFVRLARAHLETLVLQEDGRLEKRKESIEGAVRPLGDLLQRYKEDLLRFDGNLRAAEKGRGEENAGLRQQVSSLLESQENLRRETSNLVNALRLPQTRGRWGELSLRRTVELAGMAERCDFFEQVSTNTEDGRLRPDMIIRLPAGREIVVDSKVALNAYLDALNATSEEERRAQMARHASQVREHVESLSSKEYPRQFERAPEFVVLFLPGDPFYSAAVQCDPTLFEDSIRRGVILATPMTLIALLRIVERGWRQAEMEENARRIGKEGQDLYDRAGKVFEHLAEVGDALRRAMESYNKAAGSLNIRLLPSARRLKELGATTAAGIPPLEPQEGTPRPLELPEDETKAP